MKKLLLLFLILGSFWSLQAQVSKTVALSAAGTLSSTLTVDELNTTTNLTLTGTIDARDFRTMRDLMPVLADIDLSGADIVSYSGSEGPSLNGIDGYDSNAIPQFSFNNGPNGKTSLVSLKFPNTTISIGQNALQGCVNLTGTFNIPSSVISINSMAFYGCTGLTSVNIPATVAYIGDYQFCYCKCSIVVDPINQYYASDDGVLFDKNKTTLIYCPNIKTGEFVVPLTVKNIYGAAFSSCDKLTTITLHSAITSIGGWAFDGCTSLTSVIIPQAVNSIDLYAFRNCTSLNLIVCQRNTPLVIPGSTFEGVNKATCKLNVPYGTASLYAAAAQWKDFANIVEATNGFRLSTTSASIGAAANSTATIDLKANVSWTASSDQSWLTVSPSSGTSSVTLSFTAGANLSLAYRKATVTVSSAGYDSQIVYVKQDGSNAPLNITAGTLSTTLTANELALAEKLTLTGTIDARDFRTMRDLMPKLAEIDLSACNIAAYSGTEGTYYGNNNTYQGNSIPYYAFKNPLTWPGGKTILTSIKLPTTATAIYNNAFQNCTNLNSISIPSSVTSIESFAFDNCNGLSSVAIPNSVITIGNNAFTQTGLTSVSIPSSVKTIGVGCFMNCYNLPAIDVDPTNPNLSSVDGVLFDKAVTTLIAYPIAKSTTDYIIPSSVTKIGDQAFWDCMNIQSITIPNSVKTIGDGAFTGLWGITELNLPSSITSIMNGAFQSCGNLTSITVHWPVPLNISSSYNVFNGINKTSCILNVPYGTKSLYAAANQWKDFTNIVEAANGFSLGAATANIGAADGSTTTVDLKANVSWAASSNQSWLTVAPASGTASATLSLTAAANTSVATRSATVTVSATGYDSQTLLVTQDGNNGPVNITAGTLSTTFSANELASITKLTLTGNIDARDFKTMRDLMPMLAEIDLTGTNIVAYTGTEGTSVWSNNNYAANAVPEFAFLNSTWQGKPTLTNIKLPATATAIAQFAFLNCQNLVEVVIPNSVQTISYEVFGWCNKLTTVTIPSSVTSIDYDTFIRCPALITVDASNLNYSSIDGVLYNKNKTFLRHVPFSQTGNFTVPSTVVVIAVHAFQYSQLSSVTIPSSVTTIQSEAFFNCNGVNSMTIPSSVTTIQDAAFAYCYNLTSIIVGRTVPADLSPYQNVFVYTKDRCTLKVPYGTKALYSTANQWKDFMSIVEPASGFLLNTYTANVGSAAGSTTSVTIQSNVNWASSSDQPWLSITPASEYGNKTITFTAQENTSILVRKATVTVSSAGIDPQTILVTQDGANASITITAGTLSSTLSAIELANITYLTLNGTIDARDFKTMRDLMPLLSKIDLSGATIVEYTGTEGTYTTGNYTYPANEVPRNAFWNKLSLTSITIPLSAKTIARSALNNCDGLIQVTFGANSQLTTIGYLSFAYCDKLTNIQVPSSVTLIDYGAFYSCPQLAIFSFGPSVQLQSIGYLAFGFCLKLNTFSIPSTVTFIDNFAFIGSSAYIIVDSNNANYSGKDGVLFNKNLTRLIFCPTSKSGTYSIPSSVTNVASEAFYNCSAITSITIPEGLATLEDWAFENCTGLTTLSLPKTLTAIGNEAFYNCSGLTSLYAFNPTPVDLSSKVDVFYNIDKSKCTLFVPLGTESLYGTALKWKDFLHIKPINQAPVANAGADKTVNENTLVTLDGSASSDPDENPIAFAWTAPAGITLSGTTTVRPTFMAPEVKQDTQYKFSLTVSDGTLTSTIDEVVITVKQVNKAPVANAGLIQTVNEGDLVTLNGTGSYDFDGDPLKYYWTAPDGITLSSVNTATPTFKAPEVKKETSFLFTLYVNDGQTNSIFDQVVIVVKNIEHTPVANAGVPQSIKEGLMVTLDGSLSTDIDGDHLAYKWTAPEGITLSSTTSEKPTFTAPMVTKNTDYLFMLVVNDGKANSATGTVTITVLNENNAPVANAGIGQTVSEGTTVSLNGSGSTDADGDQLTYKWTAPDGIILNSVSIATPTFTAPEVKKNTSYVFTLVVNDGTVDSSVGQVTITVTQVNKAPVANAGVTQTAIEGAKVTLEGSSSTDVDGDLLTYKWTTPDGITLSGTSTANPSFIAPATTTTATYTFGLVVNDGQVDSQQATVTITVIHNWTASPWISNSTLKMYPNPVSGLLTIDFAQDELEEVEVSIFNIQGGLILQQKLAGPKQTIDMSDFVPGSYLAKVKSGEKIQSQIIIKK